jgi:hypothetical protein
MRLNRRDSGLYRTVLAVEEEEEEEEDWEVAVHTLVDEDLPGESATAIDVDVDVDGISASSIGVAFLLAGRWKSIIGTMAHGPSATADTMPPLEREYSQNFCTKTCKAALSEKESCVEATIDPCRQAVGRSLFNRSVVSDSLNRRMLDTRCTFAWERNSASLLPMSWRSIRMEEAAPNTASSAGPAKMRISVEEA